MVGSTRQQTPRQNALAPAARDVRRSHALRSFLVGFLSTLEGSLELPIFEFVVSGLPD